MRAFARSWEAVKRSFGGVPSKTSVLACMARSELRVVLPPGLVQAIGPLRLAPTRLSARRCRRSYGVGMSRPWTNEDAVSNAASGYPTKWWNEDKQTYYAGSVFNRLAKRGELVAVSQVVKMKCSPARRLVKAVPVTLYETPSNEARYYCEPDMRQLAHVTIDLPKDWASKVSDPEDYPLEAPSLPGLSKAEPPVQVEVRFGATELSLVARDLKTGNAVATTISWTGDVE
ncbi:hypothetical protein TSOC_008971 [Tetrabaena socialis]|uniref:Uncharacterized protein n=1 Tax=Tetrabaena socialis TaxID=47790 RepID=A0A2J7ZXB8_9CHLO|nr:hypothetical protein TSOC_008971 [Tetrabaena socialis]|eukprot:PNH04920.1 hypothetical protein TSOC_008971 [Tetrabaena socialis]